MTSGDILVIAFLLLLVGMIIRKMIADRKKGTGCHGCAGCSGCTKNQTCQSLKE